MMDGSIKKRVGIIGIGGIGGYAQLPSYVKKGIPVTAICDCNNEMLQTIGNQYQIENRFVSAEDLISCDEVDVVDIATPPATHYEMIRLCNKYHKKIVIQKPLCCSTSDFENIQKEIVDSEYIKLNTTGRYVSAWSKVKKLLCQNEIGKVMMCTFENNDWWDREKGRWDYTIHNYIIFEMMIHHLDLCLFWFGKPVRVAARGGKNPKMNFDQMNWVTATLEYENGTIVQLIENWSMPEYSFSSGHPFERILITGEEGVICANSETVQMSKVGQNSINVWHMPALGQTLPGENLSVRWFIDSFGEAMEDYLKRMDEKDNYSKDKQHLLDLTYLTLKVSEACESNSWIEI